MLTGSGEAASCAMVCTQLIAASVAPLLMAWTRAARPRCGLSLVNLLGSLEHRAPSLSSAKVQGSARVQPGRQPPCAKRPGVRGRQGLPGPGPQPAPRRLRGGRHRRASLGLILRLKGPWVASGCSPGRVCRPQPLRPQPVERTVPAVHTTGATLRSGRWRSGALSVAIWPRGSSLACYSTGQSPFSGARPDSDGSNPRYPCRHHPAWPPA